MSPLLFIVLLNCDKLINSGGSSASITSTLNTIGNSGNYLGSSIDGSFDKWSGKLKNVIFFDYVISNSYALANSYQAAGSILYSSGKIIFFQIFILIA